ncbi:MAG: O-acetyl-ADP-ribose deacetylase [bacterium]
MSNIIIEVVLGDITKLEVDAIVNAANNSLLGGGGVDGAIHRTAGKGLLEECKKLNGCKTGDAKITKGYNLLAKNVIHTVGPVWSGGKSGEPELLKDAYLSCLKLAVNNNIKTIAFPSISTGIYGYPIELASLIAINTVKQFLANSNSLKKIYFVCFCKNDYDVYTKQLGILKND